MFTIQDSCSGLEFSRRHVLPHRQQPGIHGVGDVVHRLDHPLEEAVSEEVPRLHRQFEEKPQERGERVEEHLPLTWGEVERLCVAGSESSRRASISPTHVNPYLSRFDSILA